MPSPGLRDEGENNVLSYLYIDLAIELFRAARRELNKHRLWSFRPSRRSSLCVRYTYRKRIFVRYPLAQVASIFGVCWCKIRKSSLRGCFPASRSRQRIPLLLSLSPLRKQCYSAHAGGGDSVPTRTRVRFSRCSTSVAEQTSKTLLRLPQQLQLLLLLLAARDCDTPRLIRPLTNHSVRDGI